MTDLSNNRFDVDKFYSALDAIRKSQEISWRKVADETKLSASLFTRMRQGKKPDVDGLVTLANWADLDIEEFSLVHFGKNRSKETFSEIAALLRADPKLDNKSAEMLEAMLRPAYEHLRRSRD